MAETVKPRALRIAIADSIAKEVKAYDVAAFCMRLGLSPQSEDEDPMRSKRMYLGPRLNSLGLPELIQLAH